MRNVIPFAIARAGYLYPELTLEETEAGIAIKGITPKDLDTVRKDLNYLLYREHIRIRFEPIRQQAWQRLVGGTA
uniref:Uncharacterized protein n=1 Tax=Aquisalinus luteolus TaxID=1566827 RepID=A0A8J3A2R9_9PROT|nr:hypothetical protein GCM10011355_09110 [Aquisalinus luteolus]